MLTKLFGSKKVTITAPIRFYKANNGFPEHGTLYVDHGPFKLTNEPITFGFVDINPPEMTPDLLAHIWDQAERAGFIVRSLRSYATVFSVQPTPRNISTPVGAGQRTGIARTVRRPSGDRAVGRDTSPSGLR